MNRNNLTGRLLKNLGFTLLSEGKTIKVKAEGYSMYPAVKPGSVIYIEPPLISEELLPGEIIAWKRESGFVVHRLVRITKEGSIRLFTTRGDSSLAEDDPVTFDEIAGKVIKIENSAGKSVPLSSYNKRRPIYTVNRILLRIKLYLDKAKRIFAVNAIIF